MSVRVAIIGTGVMGADHAKILASDVTGAILQVICDANEARARELGDYLGAAHVLTDPIEALSRTDVDAVLIASPDNTHADLTIAAVAAGKHVLCEKPLAPTSQESLRVIEAESRLGERRVHVGFMRRFDPAYGAMKSAMEDGVVGDALMMHNFHRNVIAPEWFTGEMAISNSAPHEFDICRFVVGTEYLSVLAVQMPSRNSIAPVFLVLKTSDGQMVNIEVNNNAAYGYDVRCELVRSTGSVDLKARSRDLQRIASIRATVRCRLAPAFCRCLPAAKQGMDQRDRKRCDRPKAGKRLGRVVFNSRRRGRCGLVANGHLATGFVSGRPGTLPSDKSEFFAGGKSKVKTVE
jgi:myo-inositol 2-dehydrogenase/D-chiro-inositol 1-dehydrogenase